MIVDTADMAYGKAISSMSLGRANVHSLEHKLNMACKYEWKGIELFYEDLEGFATDTQGGNNRENRIAAARQLRRMCDDRSIRIISMQPFYHYEGLRDRQRHDERIEQLREWFEVAKILGTDLILIPSNFLPRDQLSGKYQDMVADLREVADLGSQQTPVIRFAYESLAWGTYVSTWQQCWYIVRAVNRPNLGICLDAFNIAGLVWADPTRRDGCTPDHKQAIQSTVSELVETLDPTKIFLVQLADAERLREPLVEGHELFDPSQPARMSWSRNCRLFYGEEGSYLPVRDIATAIIHGLEYRGWISAELFNRRMSDADEAVPEELAQRGSDAWEVFMHDMGIDMTATTTITTLKIHRPNFATVNKALPSTVRIH